MDPMTQWTQWVPPYDPRQMESSTVFEDEHGRLIEVADCGERCPGCGVCCGGYRDRVTDDYAGLEEFEGNLKLGRGGLVKLESGCWYRVASCGEACPGYEQCCAPFDLRQRPQTVADARRVLLERDDGQLWEMQEALLILAHEGTREAVEVLETFMPRAHVRVAGFAECALDEGCYFAAVPHNEEEAHAMMKREVRQAWEDRATRAHVDVDEEIEPELERLRYEQEIAQRLLDKAQDEATRETWQIQVSVLQHMICLAEGRLAEQRAEIDLCEAMISEIELDLGPDYPM